MSKGEKSLVPLFGKKFSLLAVACEQPFGTPNRVSVLHITGFLADRCQADSSRTFRKLEKAVLKVRLNYLCDEAEGSWEKSVLYWRTCRGSTFFSSYFLFYVR